MPKRTDVKRVLIIGSGLIQIGQAAESDPGASPLGTPKWAPLAPLGGPSISWPGVEVLPDA